MTLLLKTYRKEILAIIILSVIFILVSLLAQYYKSEISDLVILGGFSSILIYITLAALFEMFIVPLDLVILIPIGVAVWGPIPTALMSILGWTIGAGVAFLAARLFGTSFVKKLTSLPKIYAMEKYLKSRDLFWSIVFLRISFPFDILSYALGLFSNFRFGKYLLATMIGVTPLAFVFAFGVSFPIQYQVLLFSLGLLAIIFSFFVYRRSGLT